MKKLFLQSYVYCVYSRWLKMMVFGCSTFIMMEDTGVYWKYRRSASLCQGWRCDANLQPYISEGLCRSGHPYRCLKLIQQTHKLSSGEEIPGLYLFCNKHLKVQGSHSPSPYLTRCSMHYWTELYSCSMRVSVFTMSRLTWI